MTYHTGEKVAELSGIIDGKLLAGYSAWSSHIDSLMKEAETQTLIKDKARAAEEIKKAFENAIEKRVPKDRFGIFFSGGVDSSLIAYACKKHTEDFVCYTVGLKGSKDIEFSKKVAKKYNLTHKIKEISIEGAENLFIDCIKILGKENTNIVNLGVGSVVLAGIRLAKKDNLAILFSGLGSEEIFAGYQRHEKAGNINEECWNGLKTMWERDFLRDSSLANEYDIKLMTPFLDKEMIRAAMSIDGCLKIRDGIKKYILREAAYNYGLEKEFAFRPKIAAQYGSSIDKAISFLGRKRKMRYKKDYISFLISQAGFK